MLMADDTTEDKLQDTNQEETDQDETDHSPDAAQVGTADGDDGSG